MITLSPARRFALSAALIAVGTPALAQTYAYVSNADSGTITRYKLDTQTGKLTLLGATPAAAKVMPMALSPDRQHLYSAERTQPWSVITWQIDRQTGDLQQQAVTPVAASFPYIAVDKSGRYLLGASYDSDIVTSNRIDAQGKVTALVTGSYHTGPHAHSVIPDNTNRVLFVGNLGSDRVLQLRLADNGAISALGDGYVQDEKNSGPRHSVVSPDNRYLYNLAEMAGTITQYRLGEEGALSRVQRWPNAVAAQYHLQHGKERSGNYTDPTPRIWSADIKMTPNGHFLYVSERTSSTVSGYRVDGQSGALTLIGSWAVEQQPRGIAVDDSGKWLVVSGEKSPVVGSYAIDPRTGALARVSEAPCGKDANWVTLVSVTL
ncbi:6-phosphogluconolactonase [Sodalis praecaptivus]|uniref:6-phosphogluconolactonase n=1 Tax=Sodalis praecaptivus TaxID=1239307 RepID=W0HWK7_9GAMM|nr:beta-propeller fold lactonase family protein [Sodalis praecaptivus]AHF76580.1 6-phosphogluconolactonase [Sodalis praecaptivus]